MSWVVGELVLEVTRGLGQRLREAEGETHGLLVAEAEAHGDLVGVGRALLGVLLEAVGDELAQVLRDLVGQGRRGLVDVQSAVAMGVPRSNGRLPESISWPTTPRA